MTDAITAKAALGLMSRAVDEIGGALGAFDEGLSLVAEHKNGPVTWGRQFLDTRSRFAQGASFLRNGATIADASLEPELAKALRAHADSIDSGLALMNRDQWPDRSVFSNALTDATVAQEQLAAIVARAESGPAVGADAATGVRDWMVDGGASTVTRKVTTEQSALATRAAGG